MGETSSRTGGRGRRGARPTDSTGEHCTMCGTTVAVDARGRCPLGHRVRAPEDADGVIAAYAEPPPHPAAPVEDDPVEADPVEADPVEADPVEADPVEADLPSEPPAAEWRRAWDASAAEPSTLSIPDRLRQPLPPAQTGDPAPDQSDPAVAVERATDRPDPAQHPEPDRPHPLEPGSPPPDTDHHDPDTTAAGVVPGRAAARQLPGAGPTSALGDAPTGEGHVPVPMTDLSPGAPSILDDVPASDWGPTVMETTGYDQEPLEDDADVVPPAGWGTRLAGVVFVLLLLAAAWYLATSL